MRGSPAPCFIARSTASPSLSSRCGTILETRGAGRSRGGAQRCGSLPLGLRCFLRAQLEGSSPLDLTAQQCVDLAFASCSSLHPPLADTWATCGARAGIGIMGFCLKLLALWYYRHRLVFVSMSRQYASMTRGSAVPRRQELFGLFTQAGFPSF